MLWIRIQKSAHLSKYFKQKADKALCLVCGTLCPSIDAFQVISALSLFSLPPLSEECWATRIRIHHFLYNPDLNLDPDPSITKQWQTGNRFLSFGSLNQEF
jgi:hypothetical protein